MADSEAAADEADLALVRDTASRAFRGARLDLDDIADLGWLGLLCPVDVGGSGWFPKAAVAIADEAGRYLDRTGWAAAALGAAALGHAQDGSVERLRVVGAIDGSQPVRWVSAELVRDLHDGQVSLTGQCSGLVGAERSAAFVIVSSEGPFWLVERDQVDIALEPTTLDTAGPVHRLGLRQARAREIALPPAAENDLRAAALTMGAAAAAGSLSTAIDRLVAYLSDRIAFGAPIASFQAVQHRLVDLYLVQRRMSASIDAATNRLVVRSPDALRASCVAHAYVAKHAVDALDECIQLSGGIGFVWEYPLHHELRGALTDTNQFGTLRSSRSVLARLDGW